MSADARRAQIVGCAGQVFSRRTYGRATMDHVAAEAGVNKALLYQHFPSKAELFAACLDVTWETIRTEWDAYFADPPAPREWLLGMSIAFIDRDDSPTPLIGHLIFQALGEGAHEPVVLERMRDRMADIHDYVTRVIERSQQLPGGINPERDARAEAWIFVSQGLFLTASQQLGDMFHADLPRVVTARRSWLYDA